MMKHDKDIVIVVADMSTPIFDKVREDFPHRFFKCWYSRTKTQY